MKVAKPIQHLVVVLAMALVARPALAQSICFDLFTPEAVHRSLAPKGPPAGVREEAPPRHWKQLDPATRFINTSVLRSAYLAPPKTIVDHAGEKIEIAIVVPKDSPEVALRVSNVLSRSIDLARASRKGHIPDPVVSRLQDDLASPHAVADKWAGAGHRFVISRSVPDQPGLSEVLGTVLVAKDHDTIFFLSGQHDKLKPHRNKLGQIDYYLDHANRIVNQATVDKEIASALPPLSRYKPDGLYQIANFALHPEIRGGGLGKQILMTVIGEISSGARDYQGRPLFPRSAGWGFWQVGEPPWQRRMRPMNFLADPSQHAYLIPMKNDKGAVEEVAPTGALSHLDFNKSYGVFEEYYVAAKELLEAGAERYGHAVKPSLARDLSVILKSPIGQQIAADFEAHPEKMRKLTDEIRAAGIKFPERLPQLFQLARSGTAKLQYKNLSASFDDVLHSDSDGAGATP